MARLRPPTCDPDWALFLDLDGTLLEIAETPAAVRVPERLTGAARDPARSSRRAPSPWCRDAASPTSTPARAAAAPGRRRARRASVATPPGRCIACNPTRRLAAPRARASRRSSRAIRAAARGQGLGPRPALPPRARPGAGRARRGRRGARGRSDRRFQLIAGKRVLEIAPRGASKAARDRAVHGASRRFAGARAAFVGDDLTDESGFAVVNRLGGHSVKRGRHAATRARWRLAERERTCIRWLESCSTEAGVGETRSMPEQGASISPSSVTARSPPCSIGRRASCGAACRASTATRPSARCSPATDEPKRGYYDDRARRLRARASSATSPNTAILETLALRRERRRRARSSTSRRASSSTAAPSGR